MSDPRAQLAQVIAEAARALVGFGPPALPVDRENVNTRAAIPVEIPQATGQDLQSRGVKVRALSADQRLDAEVAAYRWVLRRLGPPPAKAELRDAYLIGFERLVDRRAVIEEAALMIIEPPDMTAATVGGWGDAVVQTIHLAGVRAETYPAELVNAELARLTRGPLPPEPGDDAGEPQPDDAGLDAGAE